MLPAPFAGLLAAGVVALAMLALAAVLFDRPARLGPRSHAPRVSLRDAALLAGSVAVALVAVTILWLFSVAVQWTWRQGPGWVIGSVVSVVAVAFYARHLRAEARRQAAADAARREWEEKCRREEAEAHARRLHEATLARARFADEQRRRGLVPHPGPNGVERWVTPAEAAALARREAASDEEAMVRACLDAFTPSMRHDHELPYHMELLGYLRARLPAATPEVQVGSSRPDIVVGRIAIEVKGPTDMLALQTVADKCLRYGQHFDVVLVVLFDVTVGERMYAEWERGMARTFPQVGVVRKQPTRGPASFGGYSSRVSR